MTTKKLSTNLIQAKLLIDRGALLKDAAATIRMHPDVLSKKLRAAGFTIPKGGKPAYNRKKLPEAAIVKLYQSGYGTSYLAKAYTCTPITINYLLRRNGVQIRTTSAAGSIQATRQTPEERKNRVSKARDTRASNLKADSSDPASVNPAIGIGYHFIVGVLQAAGFRGILQRPVDNYYVDFLSGSVAVEIEYRPKLGLTHKSIRLKQLLKRNLTVIYILHQGVDSLTRHLDQLITQFKLARSAPSSAGEYWVIRCDLNRGIANTKYQYGTNIPSTKHSDCIFISN